MWSIELCGLILVNAVNAARRRIGFTHRSEARQSFGASNSDDTSVVGSETRLRRIP